MKADDLSSFIDTPQGRIGPTSAGLVQPVPVSKLVSKLTSAVLAFHDVYLME